MAMSDEEAFSMLKELSGANSVQGFQALDRDKQAKTLAALRSMGASERQLARLSGFGRTVVARLSRSVKEQTA